MFGSREQFPLLPGQRFPGSLKARLFSGLQWDIQRQRVNLPARLRSLPDFPQRGRHSVRNRAQTVETFQIEMTGANAQLVAAFVIHAANFLLRHPRHR
ncbi:hypothetical protein D3C76_1307870 [compost metagenome]